MIFPIGDDNVKGGAYPIFSYLFLVINIAVFIITVANLDDHVRLFGADPCKLERLQNIQSILTSMFMHGGIMHLVGNMLFLWIFADNIESTIGNIRFLAFYLAGGFIAAITHVAISGSAGCIPMVGASGAIAAVMGAYLAMFPKSRIKLLFLITVFRIPAFIFLGLWIGEQILSGLSDIRIFNDPREGGGVAFWAHIGGFVFGFLMGLFFKKWFPKIEHVEDRNDNHEEYKTVKLPAKRYNNRF